MKILDIMTGDVATAGPTASVLEAARVMKDREVGMLPVLEGGQVVGVLTDRNITVRAIATGVDPRQCPVSEIMTVEIVYCLRR